MAKTKTKKERKNRSVVRIEVNVTSIVKYLCVTGVLVVAIIFGCKAWSEAMESASDFLPSLDD